MSRIPIVFTGGTISMQPDPVAGGNRPVLAGAEILARSPAVAEMAHVEAIDWGLVPASHLSFEQMLDLARLIQALVDRPDVDGVVVVQGTDSLEETAFAFDLLVNADKPVVVTGAMRDAASPEYDGPRNLADAVTCATSERLGGDGVVVTLAGALIAADDVVKAHATALDAFRSRDGAPLGAVSDGRVRLSRHRGMGQRGTRRRRRLAFFPGDAVEDVYLVTATVGSDGTLVRGLTPLQPRGLVVAATGSGNTHPDMLAAARELMATGTIVCLSTRCAGGAVAPIYAFPGGGATWQEAGALMSALDGPKTRVALALGLAAGMDREALAGLLS